MSDPVHVIFYCWLNLNNQGALLTGNDE